MAGEGLLPIRVEPGQRKIHVLAEGEVQVLDLYRAIRSWEASEEGIVFAQVLEGTGNVALPDGTRTPRCIVLVGGWQLTSAEPISIVDGYVAARDEDGEPSSPIAEESASRIGLLTDAEESTSPSESQVRHALLEAAKFREDWDINVEGREVHRRADASERHHSILALYWFFKEEYLRRGSELARLTFPISYEGSGPSMSYTWASGWTIRVDDLPYLEGGPLRTASGDLLVAAEAISGEAETPDEVTAHGDERDTALGEGVTVGLVTALPKEYAAVGAQMDDVIPFQGRTGTHYRVGTMAACNGQKHIVALAMSGAGNNSAAVRATCFFSDFPKLTRILMVGIAGAVPSVDDPENHVRLGDIVVSGEHGVIQYDYDKENATWTEPRHRPRPPGADLLAAAKRLEADRLTGQSPWLDRLGRTSDLADSDRPDVDQDVLVADGRTVEHPSDPSRRDGEPRVFMGTIGAANKLLKNPDRRDQLRDDYGIRAIEMEGAGISDASWDFQVSYLVVRATCDYCDENKNDVWQGHAAALAAAYTAALLSELFPTG